MADLIGRINRTYTDWPIELEADAEVWESVGTTPERQAAGKDHYRQLIKNVDGQQCRLEIYVAQRAARQEALDRRK
jgi:hypothetical protein